mmetsp:Transcript_1436/g.2977  ORF Transcript_1436/g.2977 Transcript_1436/m.2977 type:complete len:254 (+) Transcript_1436:2159-2920(+)
MFMMLACWDGRYWKNSSTLLRIVASPRLIATARGTWPWPAGTMARNTPFRSSSQTTRRSPKWQVRMALDKTSCGRDDSNMTSALLPPHSQSHSGEKSTMSMLRVSFSGVGTWQMGIAKEQSAPMPWRPRTLDWETQGDGASDRIPASMFRVLVSASDSISVSVKSRSEMSMQFKFPPSPPMLSLIPETSPPRDCNTLDIACVGPLKTGCALMAKHSSFWNSLRNSSWGVMPAARCSIITFLVREARRCATVSG